MNATATEVLHAQEAQQRALIEALTAAMKAQRVNAKAHSDQRASMGNYRWIRDFCVIRLQVGRDVGSTTLMASIAQAQRGDVIVARGAKHIADMRLTRAAICTAEQFEGHVVGNRLGTVYVDEPSITLRGGVETFFELLSRVRWHLEPLVVMMGA